MHDIAILGTMRSRTTWSMEVYWKKAQRMAAHESPKTTRLYDRTQDAITLDKIECIDI